MAGKHEPVIKGQFISDYFGEKLNAYTLLRHHQVARSFTHDETGLLCRTEVEKYRPPEGRDDPWWYLKLRYEWWRFASYKLEKWNGRKRTWVAWGSTAPKWTKMVGLALQRTNWRQRLREEDRAAVAAEHGEQPEGESEQLSLF